MKLLADPTCHFQAHCKEVAVRKLGESQDGLRKRFSCACCSSFVWRLCEAMVETMCLEAAPTGANGSDPLLLRLANDASPDGTRREGGASSSFEAVW